MGKKRLPVRCGMTPLRSLKAAPGRETDHIVVTFAGWLYFSSDYLVASRSTAFEDEQIVSSHAAAAKLLSEL